MLVGLLFIAGHQSVVTCGEHFEEHLPNDRAVANRLSFSDGPTGDALSWEGDLADICLVFTEGVGPLLDAADHLVRCAR